MNSYGPSMSDAGYRYKKQAESRRKRSDRLSAARERGTHTMLDWCCLVAATDGICPRCETRGWTHFDKDHIVPLYCEGSSDAIENIQPLCARCNASKNDHTDWMTVRGRMKPLLANRLHGQRGRRRGRV